MIVTGHYADELVFHTELGTIFVIGMFQFLEIPVHTQFFKGSIPKLLDYVFKYEVSKFAAQFETTKKEIAR